MHRIDSKALAAHLRVWFAPLRSLGTLQCIVEDASPGKLSAPRPLWIQCGNSDITADVLEGLVALALLVRVDSALWRSILKEIWADDTMDDGHPLRPWIDSEVTELMTTQQAQKFTLGLNVAVHSPQDLKGIAATRVKRGSYSDQFQVVLQLMGVTIDPEDDALRVPVSCFIQPSGYENYDVTRSLKKILSMVTACKKQTNAGLQFEIVDIQQHATEPDMKALRLLLSIRALGVRIDRLPPLRSYCGSFKNAALLAPVLQSLLLEDQRVPGFRATGVHDVTVSDLSPLTVVEAVLSAVTVSSVVRSVSVRIEKPRGEMDHKALVLEGGLWRLVAKYLFSGHARHGVKSLDLDLHSFWRDHCNIVESVLEKDNDPFPYPRDNGLNRKVSAARFILRNQDYGEEVTRSLHHITFESAQPIEVQVLRATSSTDEVKGWVVQLPGRGDAWVAEHDVVTTTVSDANTEHVEPSTFEEITIVTSDDYLANAGQILAWIGRGTKKLMVVEHHGDSFLDAWIDAVLGSCKALQDVVITNAAVETLRPFVAHTTSRAIKLRRLTLSDVVISEVEGVVSFFEALRDPSHYLSLHLEYLDLGLHVANTQVSDLVKSAAQTLLENHTLRAVRLVLRLEEDSEVLRSMAHDAFAPVLAYDQWIKLGPLGLSSKLAFLSVLHGEHIVNRCGELDSSVISQILQLAAPTSKRQLRIQII